MIVKSTNRAEPVEISWKGKKQLTGIYKRPHKEGIYVRPEGVRGDTIGNPKVHGDRQKACYLFGAEEYPYWRALYPGLDWEYGMFGENLSLEGLVEKDLWIGSTYRLGEALLRITAPREPCFKLGIRFGDQEIIDRFVRRGRPGAYAEVLESGWVRPGDRAVAEDRPSQSLSIATFYQMLYDPEKDPAVLEAALDLPVLSDSKRASIERWLGR